MDLWCQKRPHSQLNHTTAHQHTNLILASYEVAVTTSVTRRLNKSCQIGFQKLLQIIHISFSFENAVFQNSAKSFQKFTLLALRNLLPKASENSLICGQSYKAPTIVIYDSRVIPDLKLPHIMTIES